MEKIKCTFVIAFMQNKKTHLIRNKKDFSIYGEIL